MAKKLSNNSSDSIPTELLYFKTKFNKVLDERIKLGEELYNRQVYTQADLKNNKEDYFTWSKNNSEYLKNAFNIEHNEYKKSYDDADAFFFGSLGLRNIPLDSLKSLKDKINYKISILKKIRTKTEYMKNQLPIKSIRMAM
ncbi:hypothetical protein [Flavobacterium facile]|uniref:hypothetical protein n=1 Tax=Flavobacterium facile TaxID=2893174 RepID=UPI002E75B4EF|nr:hypothetical protein [Flavobacterium sp. T-12]